MTRGENTNIWNTVLEAMSHRLKWKTPCIKLQNSKTGPRGTHSQAYSIMTAQECAVLQTTLLFVWHRGEKSDSSLAPRRCWCTRRSIWGGFFFAPLLFYILLFSGHPGRNITPQEFSTCLSLFARSLILHFALSLSQNLPVY